MKINTLITVGLAWLAIPLTLAAQQTDQQWEPLTNNLRMAMAHTSWLNEVGLHVDQFRVKDQTAEIVVELQAGDEIQVLRERTLTTRFEALYSRAPFKLKGDPAIATYWRYTACENGPVVLLIRTRAKTAFFYVVRRRYAVDRS